MTDKKNEGLIYRKLVLYILYCFKGPIAAVPVPYRCTEEHKIFQSLVDPLTGKQGNNIIVIEHTLNVFLNHIRNDLPVVCLKI